MKLTKYFKYVVVAGLAGALALAPVSEAIAAVTGEEARQEEIAKAYAAQAAEAAAPVNRTVEGTKSAVDGFYLAKNVNGVALTPSADSNVDSDSYVKVTETDLRKSDAAARTASQAVWDYVNPDLHPDTPYLFWREGPAINVTYGKMEGGKFSTTTDGSKGTLSIGLPANFNRATMEDYYGNYYWGELSKFRAKVDYIVVAVYEGGYYKVYPNIGTSPDSVTINVDEAPSANVMYRVIALNRIK